MAFKSVTLRNTPITANPSGSVAAVSMVLHFPVFQCTKCSSPAYEYRSTMCSDPAMLSGPQWAWTWSNWYRPCTGPPSMPVTECSYNLHRAASNVLHMLSVGQGKQSTIPKQFCPLSRLSLRLNGSSESVGPAISNGTFISSIRRYFSL